MAKNIFKQLSGLIFSMLLVLVLAIPASAAGTITGNNSFDTAYPVGYWKYSNLGTTILPEGENEAYFTFTANAGEKVYAKSSYQDVYSGMKIEIFDKNRQFVSAGTRVVDASSSIPFIFANANASSGSETFYVKVTRGTYTGDMYFTVSILDRIKSGSGKFNFSGTATNNGNAGLDPAGVDSSVITVDLTNNTTIPIKAIVKSVTTSSTQSPSQGNVTHKLMSSHNGVWYTSIVSSATSGSYNISLNDRIFVASKWSFKYNAKATAKSTMTNVSANINYEYDQTDQFQ